MAKTIALKGDFIRKEGITDEAVTPGHLVALGGTKDIQKHATAGGNAQKAFALENDLVGDGIDDAYDSGDTVQYGVFYRGSEVNALLAHGENVSIGDALESNGAGALQKHTPTDTGATSVEIQVEAIVAYAKEAKNNTSGDEARIIVEVA